MSNAKIYAFCDNLRATRERMGLSQQALSKLTGVKNIAHYETGMRLPSYEVLVTLCDKMEVSADSLMFGPDKKELDIQNRAMSFNRIKAIVDKTPMSIYNVLRSEE
jgi:transcriptional regulator with XRE-family HTH domain